MPLSGSGAASGAAAGAAFGPWGALIGGVAGAFLGGGQKAPATAPFTPVDLQAEQKKSLAGNIANQGDIQSLVSSTNQFDQNQASALSEQAMPGMTALRGKLTATASDLLTDPYNVPKDVQDNLARIASERGISAGTRGQFNDFSLLRDFGVNALQYGNSRINQAGSIAGLVKSISPSINPMSPLSFYVTPQQSAQVAAGNNAGQQQTQQISNDATTAERNYNAATWTNLISQATAMGAGAIGKSIAANKAAPTGGGTGGYSTPPDY